MSRFTFYTTEMGVEHSHIAIDTLNGKVRPFQMFNKYVVGAELVQAKQKVQAINK